MTGADKFKVLLGTLSDKDLADRFAAFALAMGGGGGHWTDWEVGVALCEATRRLRERRLTNALVCFPSRGNWFGKEQWVCPSQVASLVPGPHDLPNNTNVTLSGGGEIYLWDYPVAETAEMLGFERLTAGSHKTEDGSA